MTIVVHVSTLLEKCNYTTLQVPGMKTMECEVFKFVNKLNTVFMHDIFTTKYQLINRYPVFQLNFEDITYGKQTFAYYRSQMWNALPNQIKEYMDIISFKSLLKIWEGLSTNPICFKLNVFCIYLVNIFYIDSIDH